MLVVAYATSFPVKVRSASMDLIVASALFALVNGTMEEVLWRGSYLVEFPHSWFWGYVYPAIWFGLWHLAPQVVQKAQIPGGAITLALGATVSGLVWGLVAKTSGSVRWTVLTHILYNFSNLRGDLFL